MTIRPDAYQRHRDERQRAAQRARTADRAATASLRGIARPGATTEARVAIAEAFALVTL